MPIPTDEWSNHDLLAESEAFMVDDALGFGEDMFYKKVGQEPIAIRASVSNADIRRGNKEKVEDETVFYSVALSFKPRENDEILYLEDTFIVKSYSHSTSATGRYDIVTLSHQAQKHRRGKHR